MGTVSHPIVRTQGRLGGLVSGGAGVFVLPLPEDVRIYHIGSTAVGGIWAKPIVDILSKRRLPNIRQFGNCCSRTAIFAWRRAKPARISTKATRRTALRKGFHLHLRDYGDNDELYFRDYLNEHPETAKEYEKLKLSLWKPFEHDRDGYTKQKTAFVKKYTRMAVSQYGKRKWQ